MYIIVIWNQVIGEYQSVDDAATIETAIIKLRAHRAANPKQVLKLFAEIN